MVDCCSCGCWAGTRTAHQTSFIPQSHPCDFDSPLTSRGGPLLYATCPPLSVRSAATMRSTRYGSTKRQPKARRGAGRRKAASERDARRGPLSDLRTGASDAGGGAGTPSGPVAAAGGSAVGRRSTGSRRGAKGRGGRNRARGRLGVSDASPAGEVHAGDRRPRPRPRKQRSLGNVQGTRVVGWAGGRGRVRGRVWRVAGCCPGGS